MPQRVWRAWRAWSHCWNCSKPEGWLSNWALSLEPSVRRRQASKLSLLMSMPRTGRWGNLGFMEGEALGFEGLTPRWANRPKFMLVCELPWVDHGLCIGFGFVAGQGQTQAP